LLENVWLSPGHLLVDLLLLTRDSNEEETFLIFENASLILVEKKYYGQFCMKYKSIELPWNFLVICRELVSFLGLAFRK